VILVDSSVWIDYLRGTNTPQSRKLDALLDSEPIAIGDLVLAEVLQGCHSRREFDQLLAGLSALEIVSLGGVEIAVEAARNVRRLRERGVSVRKTIDTLIATRCIVDDLELLHDDRDFDAFERHLGLRCVACTD
jgi:predicted nucleic acid-binding protein